MFKYMRSKREGSAEEGRCAARELSQLMDFSYKQEALISRSVHLNRIVEGAEYEMKQRRFLLQLAFDPCKTNGAYAVCECPRSHLRR